MKAGTMSWPAALILTGLAVTLCATAGAQMPATQTFARALERAQALEAGMAATDLPLHVHYDLKLYSHKGKLTTGTWDLWRDPLRHERVDIKAGDFQYTHIDNVAEKVQWRHFNTFMPLKIFDLREDYAVPQYLVDKILEVKPPAMVRFTQIDGMPFDCTPAWDQGRICFDPIAHVIAFAQIFNQSMTWENWQPVGIHTVPRRFRIYDAGRVMVEAAGQAEPVKAFPPGLFTIPPNEPDMGEPELDGAIPHKVLKAPTVNLQPLYGNVLMLATVGADGKVKKLRLIDADDDDIIPDAKRFAKHVTFQPQVKNGTPVPFETYLYLKHGPLGP
jgi:hypothetical protein